MKVLHLHSGNLFGGVETFLLTLVREGHCAHQMRSAFAVCFDGAFSEALALEGVVPWRLGEVRLSRPLTVRRARASLRALLARETFDVAVCHQPWASVVFGPALREAGYPVVLWMHMASDGRHWLERAARLRQPDALICNSRYSAARAASWMPGVPAEVAYCPVAAPSTDLAAARHDVRGALGVDREDVVITMVARAESWKGHQVLIDACARLPNRPPWVCWIVGGAQRPEEVEYLDQLRRQVEARGVGARVRFLGARQDVRALLAASDIYCQPNLEPEPFGLALVEAQYAGLPVVTTAAGGALEIVDSTCGILAPVGDVTAVADALAGLIAEPSARARLGEAGARRAAVLCSPQTQMPHIARVLGRAASRGLASTADSQGVRRVG